MGFEVTDSKRDLRRRAQALEQINHDAVGGKHVGHGLGKQTSVVAAVMTYNNSHTAVLYVLEATFFLYFQEIVGVALSSHRHDVFVHAVGTGSHDATKTTCSKLEVTIECVNKGRFVLGFHHSLYLCAGLGIILVAQPHLRFRHYGLQFTVHSTIFLY